MGALKPWHVFVLLFCLLVVAGGVTGLVLLIRASTRPKPPAPPRF